MESLRGYDDWKSREPAEGSRRCVCGHELDDHRSRRDPARCLCGHAEDEHYDNGCCACSSCPEWEEDQRKCVRDCECRGFETADPRDDGDAAYDSKSGN